MNIIAGVELKPGFVPKTFLAKIYQNDLDAPVAVILLNTLGLSINFFRDGEGVYRGFFSKELNLVQTTFNFFTNVSDDKNGLVTIRNLNDSEFEFCTFIIFNGEPLELRDNILDKTTLSIVQYL